MTQAVLEGVAFGLYDCIELARNLGVEISRIRLCGGGGKSPIWQKIAANIFQCPIDTLQNEEGPAMGAAILAMTAAGEYDTVEQAAARFLRCKKTVTPDAALSQKYLKRWELFHQLYPAQKEMYAQLEKNFSSNEPNL